MSFSFQFQSRAILPGRAELHLLRLVTSVADPFHFDTAPNLDPRIAIFYTRALLNHLAQSYQQNNGLNHTDAYYIQ